MISFRANNIAVSVIAMGLTANLAFASPLDRPVTAEDLEPERVYSPYAGRNYPDEVLFGDTHFHTNLSFDAGLVGTTLGVDSVLRICLIPIYGLSAYDVLAVTLNIFNVLVRNQRNASVVHLRLHQATRNFLQMRLLLIEGDPDVASDLEKGLSESGYSVDRAGDGKTDLVLASTEDYDAMVIDRMLPGSGLGLSLVAAMADMHKAELIFSDNHPDLVAELRFQCIDFDT